MRFNTKRYSRRHSRRQWPCSLKHRFSHLALLFLFFPLFLCSAIPLFIPPQGWECALPQNLSPCVQIGFLGKGAHPFRPSLNLAIEEIDVSLKGYLKAVKEIHLATPQTTWRDLGKFITASGEGRLTEITMTTAGGDVRMLQMIFVKRNIAYILTGATLKDEFLQFQETFTKAFQSLRLLDDLFSPLNSEKKQQFENNFTALGQSITNESEREKQWIDWQKLVFQEAQELGSYWQFLALKSGREKLLSH